MRVPQNQSSAIDINTSVSVRQCVGYDHDAKHCKLQIPVIANKLKN